MMLDKLSILDAFWGFVFVVTPGAQDRVLEQ